MARHLTLSTTQREPAAVIGTLGAFVTALLYLLAAFGLDITDEQSEAILSMMGPTVLLIALIAALIRRKVSPVATTVATVGASGRVLAGGASILPTGVPVSTDVTLGDVLDDGLDDIDPDELYGVDDDDPVTASTPIVPPFPPA